MFVKKPLPTLTKFVCPKNQPLSKKTYRGNVVKKLAIKKTLVQSKIN